jgi:hypothetical protein
MGLSRRIRLHGVAHKVTAENAAPNCHGRSIMSRIAGVQ